MKQHFADLEKEWVDLMSAAIASCPLAGEEKGCADLYMEALEEIGAEHFRDEAGNVIGIIRGEGTGPNILLNGHMDVVPAGNLEAWGDVEPFQPQVKDGKLYGRGTSDMLSGLCCQFFAFREIKRMVDAGAKLSGNLIFSGVVMEEPAESAGALWLFEHTLPEHDLSVDLVYLGEPTNGDLYVGQRGKVELVVDVYGKVAHSSAPWQGISAVEKAQPVIQAAFNNFYEPSVTHEKLGFSAMTITDIVVTPGKMYSCVPDHCEITIDRRYVPPMTIESCIEQVQRFLDFLSEKDPEFKAEVHQRMNHRVFYTGKEMDVAKQHAAWMDDLDSEYIKKSFQALESVGQSPKEEFYVGGNDGSIFMGKHGVPTISYSWQQIPLCHQPGEYAVIEDELKEIEGYTAMLCEQFGLDFNKWISE